MSKFLLLTYLLLVKDNPSLLNPWLNGCFRPWSSHF